MKAHLPALLLLLSVFGFAGIDTYAATLTVTKIADTNDGVCNADCSLREAVVAAAPGDAIVFSALFNTLQTITLTLGQIAIDKSLTINGTGSGLLSISGNNASRIFYISGGATVVLMGMNLRDGWVGATFGEARGGAIYAMDSIVNLTSMEFTNNTALYPPAPQGLGGAIYGFNSTLIANDLNINHNLANSDAIDATNSTLDLSNSVVSDNSCGGIYADTLNAQNTRFTRNSGIGLGGESVTLVDSEVVGNGSGVLSGDGTLTIIHSTINDNGRTMTDGIGGGIVNSGNATIRDTVVRNNTKNGSGGGISNLGLMYIINSSISGNIASQHGGGIRTSIGHVFVTNSTISGNVAGTTLANALGGGIYSKWDGANPGGRITLTNSTIVNNQTTGNGGGIRQDAMGTATIRNTLIAGNTSTLTNDEDVSGMFVSDGINLIGNTTGSSGWIVSDLLNVNPLLAPLGDNGGSTFTHALLPGSPAINAGNNSLAIDPLTMLPLMQDQRGRSRFVGGRNPTVDIGAYEASYSQSPVTVSGRITTYSGRGIERTRIKIDDGQGNVFYAQTNPFGYYRLNNLIPGTTNTITVTHKLYLFTSPQFFTADQNRDDLNFTTGL